MSEDKESTAIHEYAKQDGTAAILFFYRIYGEENGFDPENVIEGLFIREAAYTLVKEKYKTAYFA